MLDSGERATKSKEQKHKMQPSKVSINPETLIFFQMHISINTLARPEMCSTALPML